MWELAIKKAEGQRIDAFELWCWRRLLRAPWTARRSNQLRSSNFKYSLEGLMLKLKLQNFGHLMKTTCLLEKTLMPGMWETRVWSLGWEDPLEEEMATHSSTLAWRIPWREEPGRLQSMGSQRVGHDWATSLSLWCWERLKAKGEGGGREWDGWIASLTQWTWT